MALPLIESSLNSCSIWKVGFELAIEKNFFVRFHQILRNLSQKALYLCKLVGAVFGRGKADKYIKPSNYLKLSNIA